MLLEKTVEGILLAEIIVTSVKHLTLSEHLLHIINQYSLSRGKY